MKKHIAATITALLLGSAATFAADIYGLKSKSLNSYGPEQYEPPVYFKYSDTATGTQPTLIGTVRTEGGTQWRADGLAYDPAWGMWFFGPSFGTTSVESTLRPLNMLNAVAGDGNVITGRHVFAAAFDAAGNLWALD